MKKRSTFLGAVTQLTTNLLLLVALLFTTTGLLATTVVAQDLNPVAGTPNCFVNSAQGYQRNPCPSDTRIQAGKCYSLSQSGNAYNVFELNCANGATIGSSFRVEGTAAPIEAPITTSAELAEDNPIITKVLKPIVQLLTAGVGVVIVIAFIISGIQYSAARDNPQMVAQAKNRILMAVISLLIFIFGFAVLQWLVPNGVL